MKKYIYIAFSILATFSVNEKIEILDRVAIIVGEGVVLESQVKNMLENIEKRYQEQGAPMPPKEVLLEQVQERLIIEELQLQMGRQAGIRVGDGELNNFSSFIVIICLLLSSFFSFCVIVDNVDDTVFDLI